VYLNWRAQRKKQGDADRAVSRVLHMSRDSPSAAVNALEYAEGAACEGIFGPDNGVEESRAKQCARIAMMRAQESPN
jgi:hypothetical protein